MVDARGAERGGERDAAAAAQLIAVDAEAQAGRGAGAQHPLGPGGVEGALLAEHVDPAHVLRDRLEHLPRDEVDVLLRPGSAVLAVVLGGDEVRAEEGDLVELPVGREGGEEARGPGLVGDGEAVAGLGLHRGGAAGGGLREPGPDEVAQALVGRLPGRRGGHADAACGVGLPGHPGLELGGAVAVEDEVGVGVDPSGQHGPTAEVLALVGRRGLRGGAGPGHAAVLDHEGGLAQHLLLGDLPGAGGVVEGGVEGPELGDAGEQGRGHGVPPQSRRTGVIGMRTPRSWATWSARE